MTTRRRMVSLAAQDIESVVLHQGLRLLSQMEHPGRRRVLAYWCARAETLPLISTKGEVIDEHPVDDGDPPMLAFISSARRETEAATAQPEA